VIRAATIDDTVQIVALAEEYCHHRGKIPDPALLTDMIVRQIRDCAFFVYEQDGEVLGGISLIAADDPMTGQKLVGKNLWYMHASASGHGLALLRHAEHYAKQIGAREIWVGVEDDRACTLLQRRGYGLAETKFKKVL